MTVLVWQLQGVNVAFKSDSWHYLEDRYKERKKNCKDLPSVRVADNNTVCGGSGHWDLSAFNIRAISLS